jgi:hypothetical protein
MQNSIRSFLLSDTAIYAALCHTSTQEAIVTELTSEIQFLYYEALDLYVKAVIIPTSY